MNISLISHHYRNSVDLIEPVEEIAFSNQNLIFRCLLFQESHIYFQACLFKIMHIILSIIIAAEYCKMIFIFLSCLKQNEHFCFRGKQIQFENIKAFIHSMVNIVFIY